MSSGIYLRRPFSSLCPVDLSKVSNIDLVETHIAKRDMRRTWMERIFILHNLLFVLFSNNTKNTVVSSTSSFTTGNQSGLNRKISLNIIISLMNWINLLFKVTELWLKVCVFLTQKISSRTWNILETMPRVKG